MKVKIGDQTIEVPQGVEVKIIEDEPKPKFIVGQYIQHIDKTYDNGVYLITEVTDRGYKVKEIVRDTKCPEWETVEIGFSQDSKLELADYDGIIDEWGDAHDAELCRKINDAWNKNRGAFYPIICALYARDIDEITDHDCFQLREWLDTDEYHNGRVTGDWSEYMTMALAEMRKEWDLYAYDYLNHIADDTDLECILNFLHYPYLPCYKD